MSHYKPYIAKFKGKKILVIGDVILDQHIQGTVTRISPEAPVPIVLQQGSPTFAPGGAANVATNLRALGAKVTIIGRIGADAEGKILLEGLRKRGISTKGVFLDRAIPTILKTRIVAHHQQVLRLDREKSAAIENPRLLQRILDFVRKHIRSYDAVIVSDYGKGMVSRELVAEVCTLAHQYKIILNVDPKVEHFGYYRGVTCITPNRSEAENAIRNIKITHPDNRKLALSSDRLSTMTDVIQAGKQLVKFLDLESLLITLGEQGMCLFQQGQDPVQIHTRAREVFDVTGAGDTVISVFTLALTSGASKLQAADLANHAAGIVVGKVGVVSVTPDELLEAVRNPA